MSSEKLALQIEALLFGLGETLSRDQLARMLNAPKADIEEGIAHLSTQGKSEMRGIVLVDDGVQLELRVTSEAAEIIERVRKDEYARDIGRAGVEVLSIILYRGSCSRSQVDFIRGVNSTQTLRTLSMRGLVRKIPNPKDERSYLYEATTELLGELGVQSIHDLPEYLALREKIEALEKERETNALQE